MKTRYLFRYLFRRPFARGDGSRVPRKKQTKKTGAFFFLGFSCGRQRDAFVVVVVVVVVVVAVVAVVVFSISVVGRDDLRQWRRCSRFLYRR